MGRNPVRSSQPDLPVAGVSWADCAVFGKKTGLRFPTEAQWEYASRAGAEEPDSESMGWSYPNAKGVSPRPVGMLEANGFGLHDMHGNVAEWCEDTFDRGFYATREAATMDPVCTIGLAEEPSTRWRVVRGGAYSKDPAWCSSATRDWGQEDQADGSKGFRPAFYPVP